MNIQPSISQLQYIEPSSWMFFQLLNYEKDIADIICF